MTAPEDRRRQILALLRRAGGPVRGAELAAALRVSRQVIVHDVALLRAEGVPVIGTPRGYLVVEGEPPGERAVLAVRHDRARTPLELYAFVDRGITVVDVIVEHPLYGEMRGNLMLSTREDVDRFLEALDRGKAQLLSALTGGVHLHTVWAPSPEALEDVRRALRKAGILLEAAEATAAPAGAAPSG